MERPKKALQYSTREMSVPWTRLQAEAEFWVSCGGGAGRISPIRDPELKKTEVKKSRSVQTTCRRKCKDMGKHSGCISK